MPSVAENQIRTAKDLFEGYNEYTADAVLRSRADNCVHYILPTSLNRPSKTNEEYREFFGPLQKVMHRFETTIHRIVNDPENHCAAVHASGIGESPVAEYKNEYAFFLEFNETGDKITKIEEFVDAAFSKNFLAKVLEWQAKQN
ncbi:hypothetical protein N7508_005878 [Penicillium antarcticum]|uniref:uncharacterized protein n=1 Tax=Penicillium antarcticum TaxID=416450 RepID=UPI00239A7833|nr:uncharacterized protein N7508_005878 [Penicillium antarcticum]KAJ5306863.1 hypothetical protein N7508_005878 [Penicillium antarcticum]